MQQSLHYQPQNDDLFVAAYPKCGTTWCQHIVYLLLNNAEPLPPDHRLPDLFPFLEKWGPTL